MHIDKNKIKNGKRKKRWRKEKKIAGTKKEKCDRKNNIY